ncbi:MAG: spore coat protein CotJB [Clostridiales bacterium]|jgi:spore coat protein JB|nr:spore coat protein CotJB [Clostridiales bacterium]
MNSQLLKLTQLDFYAIDLQLYIDTHPTDANALAEYNAVIGQADKLRAELAQKNQSTTAKTAFPEGSFAWVNEPWPWEANAN